MPGTDLIPFDGAVPVSAPLSVRYEEWPGGAVLSVIVDGPLGCVELQIRPAHLSAPGGGMSVEYHSHQPMPGADTPVRHYPVLDGVCYSDGGSGGEREALPEPVAGEFPANGSEVASWD
jgi:hypothetical protein